MNISYLVFGDQLVNYQQAYFSMLTFWGQLKEEDRLVVLTDHPDYFKVFESRIRIHQVDQHMFEDWKGKHRFFWRIKIKALQLIATEYPGQSMLYLDGDTFLFGQLEKMRQTLNQGHPVMHTNEGKLSEIPAKTTRHMWKTMKGKRYGKIEIDLDTCMWNAGVIGIPGDQLQMLNESLDICDEMCDVVDRKRLLEQFAFSIALNRSADLQSVEDQIGHYWGNKPQWNDLIGNFIVENYLNNLDLNGQEDALSRISLPELPVQIRQSGMADRLSEIIQKLFPIKDKKFVKT